MSKVLAIAALVVAVMCAPLLVALTVVGAAARTTNSQASALCGGAVSATGDWRPPFVQAYAVSPRGIGWRYHPVFKRWNFHGGQDISSVPGPGPIVVVKAGRVMRAGWDTTGYGNVVDLQHAGGIQTRYAHLATIDPAIVPGADVVAGQQLGIEGSTGASTGNHLHFEVIVDGARVDPLAFMRERGAPDIRATRWPPMMGEHVRHEEMPPFSGATGWTPTCRTATAVAGRIARVATGAANEFDESWNPLVTSKAIASATTATSATTPPSLTWAVCLTPGPGACTSRQSRRRPESLTTWRHRSHVVEAVA